MEITKLYFFFSMLSFVMAILSLLKINILFFVANLCWFGIMLYYSFNDPDKILNKEKET